MQKFIVILSNEDSGLIDDANIECFAADSSLPDDVWGEFKAKADVAGKLLLAFGDGALDVYRKWDLDGIVFDASQSEHIAKDVNYIRRQTNGKALGVISRNRRHEAMLISECEPDFVIFQAWNDGLENVRELVSWYNEMFLLQSAVVLRERIENIAGFDCDIVMIPAADYKIFVAKK